MNGIDIFDGHCDTVLACLLHGGGFARNGGHLDLERAGAYRRYAQFFALYGEPEDFSEPLSFRAIFDRCEDIRRTGSAALDLAYVAAGRLEGYLERNLKPWDFAAGMLLVSEAGGTVSGYDGAPLYPLANADVVAAPPAVFEDLLPLCGG